MTHAPKPVEDALLQAVLNVMTPAQTLMLVDKLRKVIILGYGRVTIVVHCGELKQIQTQESYDFRSEENS